VYKKMLRSSALFGIRRSKGAKGSAAVQAGGAATSYLLGKILVPVVNSLLQNAFNNSMKKLRSMSHAKKLGRPDLSRRRTRSSSSSRSWGAGGGLGPASLEDCPQHRRGEQGYARMEF
jgi:hypothetical protein